MTNLDNSEDDRSRIEALLVELSGRELEAAKNSRYTALKIGRGPNSDTINVYPQHLRCFIPSTDLQMELRKIGFKAIRETADKPRSKHWIHLHGVHLSDIEAHRDLFKAVVKESMETVKLRRSKKKPTTYA